MIASATTSAHEMTPPSLLELTGSCDVSDRLIRIVSDRRKPAQQRLSEAVAYAATQGWETCSMFELAPDLIREVELSCRKNRRERMLLSIIDGEDGDERLHVAYATDDTGWARMM